MSFPVQINRVLIKLHSRRGKGAAESFSRKNKASTAERKWRNPVCSSSHVTPAGASTSLMSRINGMTTQHTSKRKVSETTQAAADRVQATTTPPQAHANRHLGSQGELVTARWSGEDSVICFIVASASLAAVEAMLIICFRIPRPAHFARTNEERDRSCRSVRVHLCLLSGE